MKKYSVPAVMKFNPTRKGTRYEYHGKAYNAGEAVECAISLAIDGFWRKDDTPFDKGSDLSTVPASIKSWNATLVSPRCINAKDFNGIINEYLARVHSTVFIYGVEINGEIVCYEMDKAEFEKFLKSGLWKIDPSRGSVRQKPCASKAIAWLENQF